MSPFRGAKAEHLESHYASSIAGVRSTSEWQRHQSWIDKFHATADVICRQSGLQWSRAEQLASPHLARLFLTEVLKQDRGRTRPDSARRALNNQRAIFGLPTLNGNKAIADVVKAAKVLAPCRPRQVEALHVADLRRLVRHFAKSSSWYTRQLAPMMALGYMGLLRCGEFRRIKTAGVVTIDIDGNRYYTATDAAGHAVVAAYIHLPWRKQHGDKDVWIPISCRQTAALLLDQQKWASRFGCEFLFPSRQYATAKRGASIPNRRAPMGDDQFYKLFRQGLVRACKFPPDAARLWSGHSFRIGASNYLRSIGVDPEVHRLLGGWASLRSSHSYMQYSMSERLHLHSHLRLNSARHSAFSEDHAFRTARAGRLQLSL